MDAQLKGLVDDWLRWDKNDVTRKEVQELVDRGDIATLEKIMRHRIAFGTAGLRGVMRAGFTCMNDLIVLQTVQGLIAYLRANGKTDSVVIGYDARYHSRDFSRLSAEIFVQNDFKAYLFEEPVPTPYVPFAVKHLKCDAGIMVTASHNPKDDNGYKVYWSNGAQIIPPHDKGIQRAIMENLKPKSYDFSKESLEDLKNKMIMDPLEQVEKAYHETLRNLNFHREANLKSDRFITYSAMHGVGWKFAKRSFDVFGLPQFFDVEEQVHPDPSFPTAPKPNPEEENSFEYAIRTAEQKGSTLIISNDPDADRVAVCEKQSDGKWARLSGNEVGGLLAHWMMENFHRTNPEVPFSKIAVLNSAVSSKFISAMAEAEGMFYEETLTGFKWLGNLCLDLVGKDMHVLLGYEEAIGYSIGHAVQDKDGISTAAVVGEMASVLRSRGVSLKKQVEILYEKYGYFISNNGFFTCSNQREDAPRIFNAVRTKEGGKFPKALGKFGIKRYRDLTVGVDTGYDDHKPRLPVDPGSQMITFFFENGAVATFRGSGTEPKLKYYIEVRGSWAKKEETEALAREMTAVLVQEVFAPAKNNLR